MWLDAVLPQFTPWEEVFWARAGKAGKVKAGPQAATSDNGVSCAGSAAHRQCWQCC
jgi:hypothetical protein